MSENNNKFEAQVYDELFCMKGWDSDYYLGFKLSYNNEEIILNEEVYFEDPYTSEEISVKDILFEEGCYIVEVPKDFFEDEDCDKAEIINEYKEAFEKTYAQTLVKELGVYGIAYNFIENELKKSGSKKLFDGAYKNDWADIKEDDFIEMKLSELVNLTDEDVERIIREDYQEEISLREDAQREYEKEVAEREKELKEEFGF